MSNPTTRPPNTLLDPWQSLGERAAKIRKDLADLYADASTAAQYGDVANDSTIARTLLGNRLRSSLVASATSLEGAERIARNEAGRLEIRSGR